MIDPEDKNLWETKLEHRFIEMELKVIERLYQSVIIGGVLLVIGAIASLSHYTVIAFLALFLLMWLMRVLCLVCALWVLASVLIAVYKRFIK